MYVKIINLLEMVMSMAILIYQTVVSFFEIHVWQVNEDELWFAPFQWLV
jgi:hypothetical protein